MLENKISLKITGIHPIFTETLFGFLLKTCEKVISVYCYCLSFFIRNNKIKSLDPDLFFFFFKCQKYIFGKINKNSNYNQQNG